MEPPKELALNVQLVSLSEPHKEHSILEEFLTTELHKLIPEINNNDINWTDVKNRLGNELINNNYSSFRTKYMFSLCLNVLIVTGIVATKAYTRFRP